MNLPQNTKLQNGRYRIVRFISSGGFGCTYEAEHIKLKKRVAIKEFFVKDFCNRDDNTASVSVGTVSKMGLVKRLATKFCEEAQALSQLNHPGIVKVTDVFDENGTSYFVMDFIDGKSLNEMVKSQGPLPEELALQFIRQVGAALKYVHNNNRLHLDVKPGNIMVNRQGQAILIDFGASKQYDEVGGENTSTLLGKTPGYAPIEQMGNDVVKFTPSTDIYALGATLYKLLTGKTPKSATLRVSGEELDPLPENISQPVKNAVNASMELNKKNRPQTIDEFFAILNDEQTIADNDGATMVNVAADYVEKSINQANESGVDQPISNSNSSPSQNSDVSANGKNKKTLYIGIAAAALIAVLLFVFLRPSSPSSTEVTQNDSTAIKSDSIPKIKEVKDLIVKNPLGEEFKYTGPVDSLGMPNGKGDGIYTINSGDKYTGTYKGFYKNGLRDGDGEFVVKDLKGNFANSFVGVFVDDKYNEGKLTLADKSYFRGSFNKNGQPWNGEWYDNHNRLDGKVVNGQDIQSN